MSSRRIGKWFLCLVFALAGCGSPRPASPPLSPAATQLITRTGTYYADQYRLDSAEAARVDACMAAHGYPARAPATPLSAVSRDEEWRPDLPERRQHGYGLNARGVDSTGSEPPGYDAALFGPPQARYAITLRSGREFSFPTEGCLAQARSALYGNPVEAATVTFFPQDLYATLYHQVQADPAYDRVMRAWSACLGSRGYRYASPAQAKQQLVAEHANREREISVAMADAECATQVRLPATVEQLLATYAVRQPADVRAELDRVAGVRDAALRQAG